MSDRQGHRINVKESAATARPGTTGQEALPHAAPAADMAAVQPDALQLTPLLWPLPPSGRRPQAQRESCTEMP